VYAVVRQTPCGLRWIIVNRLMSESSIRKIDSVVIQKSSEIREL